ncbi:hypothetical protein D3C72_1886530 [compost metagenome]
MQAEPGSDGEPDEDEKTNETANLMVLEQDASMATQRGDIQREGQAAEYHDDHSHPVHRWLLPMAQRGIRGRETTG